MCKKKDERKKWKRKGNKSAMRESKKEKCFKVKEADQRNKQTKEKRKNEKLWMKKKWNEEIM